MQITFDDLQLASELIRHGAAGEGATVRVSRIVENTTIDRRRIYQNLIHLERRNIIVREKIGHEIFVRVTANGLNVLRAYGEAFAPLVRATVGGA